MSSEEKLASAIELLARATEKNTRVLEVLIEAMPCTLEAKLLGVSVPTIRKSRKRRQAERLMSHV